MATPRNTDHKTIWEERYSELLCYKERYGNCDVPQRWPENQGLGIWVSNQRQAKKKGKLSQERIRRLENIGFAWGGKSGVSGNLRKARWDERWEEKYAELQSYKERLGNCDVPQRWPENQSLGIWVDHQRQAKKKGKLSQERIAKMDAIGFVWARRKTS